jgi:ribonuclease HI
MQIKIYTDGAARGNPGSGGWGAIVVSGTVTELGGREDHTTNNRMELLAVIESLNFVYKVQKTRNKKLTIYTDSSYVLKGASIWIHGWQNTGWKTKAKQDVLNKDLWQRYLQVASGLSIDWQLLPGHSGISANERCDEIATTFADGKRLDLYSGALTNYKIDLSVSLGSQAKSSKSKSPRSTKPAYSYVSFVNGMAKTHKTWSECEARVKGVSNAKFKKALSREEEMAIIAGWTGV